VLRTVGQYMGKIRRMAAEFQGQFQEAMREAEMADLKKSVDEMTDAAKGITDFDPLGDVRKEVESFTADPLGEAAAASEAAEAAAAASAEATVSPDAVAAAPDTPIAPEPPAAAETKPGSGA
jgi:sec-independent protein translocase protein TatB